MSQLLILNCSLLIVCTACAGYDGGRQVIRFETGTAVTTEVDVRGIISGTALPEGDEIGVFAYSYIGVGEWTPVPDIYDNAKGTVNGSAVGLTPAYYTEYEHVFYAYYPYRSTVTAADPVIESDLFADREPDGTQIDWMWSDPVTGVLESITPVRLTFRHKTTMLWIKAGKSPGEAAELELQQITVETADSQKFRFNISTGEMTRETGGETICIITPTTADGGKYLIPAMQDEDQPATETAAKVLLMPQSAITKLSFRINGNTISTPDEWEGFEAGKEGLYTTISVVVGLMTVNIAIGAREWNEGGNISL